MKHKADAIDLAKVCQTFFFQNSFLKQKMDIKLDFFAGEIHGKLSAMDLERLMNH